MFFFLQKSFDIQLIKIWKKNPSESFFSIQEKFRFSTFFVLIFRFSVSQREIKLMRLKSNKNNKNFFKER